MKILTLENKNELMPYIEAADYNEYNSNIITMLMWSSMYEVYFEVFDHFALAYTCRPHGKKTWMMPYCALPYRKEAMSQMAIYAKTLSIPFEIHSMTLSFKNWLQEQYLDEFLVWDCYDARDYIYDRVQQQTLHGKKMQKRRNHFHAFEKQYVGRYTYKALENKDVSHVLALLATWQSDKDEEASIAAEGAGIHLLLTHMDTLAIDGGCIYIDGKLEAFIIASTLSRDTIEIHVEKANKHIRGLYIAILKLYLETVDDTIVYINREDDMGRMALRKAKTDMQPVKKIRKLACIHQPLQLHIADMSWIDRIKELWLDRFVEENLETTTFYFQHFFHVRDCWLLTSKEELICMMQIRTIKIMLNEKPTNVPFLFGVATAHTYEACSYMQRLLQHVVQQLKDKGEKFLLVQAYNWDIYKPFGFKEAYQLKRYTLDKTQYCVASGKNDTRFTLDELLGVYQRYTKHKNGYRIRDIAYYEKMCRYKALWKQQVIVHRQQDGKCDAYACIQEENDGLFVHALFYENAQACDALLCLLCQVYDQQIYVDVDCDTQLHGHSEPITHMMVKQLQDTPFPLDSLFMNEEL